MNKRISVAIDGPSGAGKSTLAKMVAKEFGFKYVDTGAIYRALGLYVLRAGVSPGDQEEVSALLPQADIKITYNEEGAQRMILWKTCRMTSGCRYIKICLRCIGSSAVRVFCWIQRSTAEKYDVVMDGNIEPLCSRMPLLRYF